MRMMDNPLSPYPVLALPPGRGASGHAARTEEHEDSIVLALLPGGSMESAERAISEIRARRDEEAASLAAKCLRSNGAVR